MEMKFWHAVALVNAGRIPESLPLFTHVFHEADDWRELVPRLVEQGLAVWSGQPFREAGAALPDDVGAVVKRIEALF